jgi:hypothetical protein
MRCRVGQTLNPVNKLVMATAGIVTLAGPVFIGMGDASAIGAQTQVGGPATSAPLAFEVASVKPHVFARGQFALALPAWRATFGSAAIE